MTSERAASKREVGEEAESQMSKWKLACSPDGAWGTTLN